MKRVIIESPLARTRTRTMADNISYAKGCLLDSLNRGEAPFASHLLYPLVLDDNNPTERMQGMDSGFAWMRFADLVAVYEDYGITEGMKAGIRAAELMDVPVERRRLQPSPKPKKRARPSRATKRRAGK